MKAKSSKRKTYSKRGVENSNPILIECSISQLSYIDALIENSILNNDQVNEINQKLSGFVSEGEAEEFINYLLLNQRCNIDGGHNYSQTDIINKLKQIK